MPIHDWSRADDGAFHHFHTLWMGDLARALNSGLLPPDYYARADQVAGGIGPDVLTLQQPSSGSAYTARQRSLLIRHVSNHRVVALIEILSPGNKASDYAFQAFLTKVGGALYQGIHLLLIDLHPPTPRDPHGSHAAIWENLHAGTFDPPADRPLTLASYQAGPSKTAFVEPVAVGMELPPMPLFLEGDLHVRVPLEPTYRSSWEGVPLVDRNILERLQG